MAYEGKDGYNPTQMIKQNREYARKRYLDKRQKEIGKPVPSLNGFGKGKALYCDECGERVGRITVSKYGSLCNHCKSSIDFEKRSYGIRIGKTGQIV